MNENLWELLFKFFGEFFEKEKDKEKENICIKKLGSNCSINLQEIYDANKNI